MRAWHTIPNNMHYHAQDVILRNWLNIKWDVILRNWLNIKWEHHTIKTSRHLLRLNGNNRLVEKYLIWRNNDFNHSNGRKYA